MNTLVSRLRSRPILAVIGVVALVLAVMFAVIAWVGSGSVSGEVNSREVLNTAGQYRFEAPNGWSSTQDGRTTTLVSPDQKTVITLGVGHPGSLPVAGALFFQQVASNYRNVAVIPPEAKQVDTRPALIYGGVGNNTQNTRIRFLAITVKNDPVNYAIAVFTEAGSDPKVVLPPVNRVVDTFRALPHR